jgi:polyphosphate kinase 2 (PPK2 family)
MGFASKEQVESFLENVVRFEKMLVHDGIELRKYYLDISKKEQKVRLAARQKSSLKSWKVSPIDACATKMWDEYSRARDEMLRRTSHDAAPWHVVHTDTKKIARLEFLRDLLAGFSYPHKNSKLTRPNRSVVFPWREGVPIAK